MSREITETRKGSIHLPGHGGKSPARMNGAERRRQLIEVATAVFSEKGFSGSTTKEIAALADINEATIFRHFESKEALYDAVVGDKFNAIRNAGLVSELNSAAAQDDDEAVLKAAGRLVLERYRSSRDVLRLLIFGILENRRNVVDRYESEIKPLRDVLTRYIEKRQSDGAMREQNAALVVFGFIGMVTHHATSGELVCRNNTAGEDDTALRTYANLILDGLKKP